jgi:DNA repair protein RadA/Sms
MAKGSSVFVCNSCGAQFAKWQGKCPECGQWNTIEETLLQSYTPKVNNIANSRLNGFAGDISNGIVNLSNVSLKDLPRIHLGFQELDRVLGGGIVPGSVVLIGGNPGAGKSTLLLQMVSFLSVNNIKVLYITGEESLQQVALRAERLGLDTSKIRIATETSVDKIIFLAEKEKPQVMVIDSIQVMHVDGISSAPGSVSQVREGAAALTQFSKKNQVATFIVGHVTKDGTLAGPKILEHCVDCSVVLEGDSDSHFRTLRCQKNRFGAVNEIGVFAMLDKGMREVSNPSAIFLNRSVVESPGSVVMVVWVGSRPLLVELQALVDDSQYGNPRRLSIGTDINRLAMLLAVLHRHGNIAMGDQDVFINVVGGVKVDETSADLPLVVSLISSYYSKPIPRDTIVFGEIGLSGEIRAVNSGTDRLIEAQKHGFRRAIIPKDNMPRKTIDGISIHPVTKLQEVLDLI